jgi:1,4-dihydroxy-6-naphthoate synthase
VDYGDEGRRAIKLLLDEGHKAKIIPHKAKVDFVE